MKLRLADPRAYIAVVLASSVGDVDRIPAGYFSGKTLAESTEKSVT